MNDVKGVLFDLDGTLIDTAPDLLTAVNKVRQEYQLPDLDLSGLRDIANLGAKALMKLAFDVNEEEKKFEHLRERFLVHYMQNIAGATQLFPQMDEVLHYLEEKNIPWGIVTNKQTKPTLELLKALNLYHRPACIICGDSLAKAKPDPAPILHACNLIKQSPASCLYIGDAVTDVNASKAAGTKTIVALYGYIHHQEDPLAWEADAYIKTPLEIIDLLR